MNTHTFSPLSQSNTWHTLEARRREIVVRLERLDLNSKNRELTRGRIGVYYSTQLRRSMKKLLAQRAESCRINDALLSRFDTAVTFAKSTLAKGDSRRVELSRARKKYSAQVHAISGKWIESRSRVQVEELEKIREAVQNVERQRIQCERVVAKQNTLDELVRQERARLRTSVQMYNEQSKKIQSEEKDFDGDKTVEQMQTILRERIVDDYRNYKPEIAAIDRAQFLPPLEEESEINSDHEHDGEVETIVKAAVDVVPIPQPSHRFRSDSRLSFLSTASFQNEIRQSCKDSQTNSHTFTDAALRQASNSSSTLNNTISTPQSAELYSPAFEDKLKIADNNELSTFTLQQVPSTSQQEYEKDTLFPSRPKSPLFESTILGGSTSASVETSFTNDEAKNAMEEHRQSEAQEHYHDTHEAFMQSSRRSMMPLTNQQNFSAQSKSNLNTKTPMALTPSSDFITVSEALSTIGTYPKLPEFTSSPTSTKISGQSNTKANTQEVTKTKTDTQINEQKTKISSAQTTVTSNQSNSIEASDDINLALAVPKPTSSRLSVSGFLGGSIVAITSSEDEMEVSADTPSVDDGTSATVHNEVVAKHSHSVSSKLSGLDSLVTSMNDDFVVSSGEEGMHYNAAKRNSSSGNRVNTLATTMESDEEFSFSEQFERKDAL